MKWIGSIGLLLDLVGVILLFKYGFPQPDFSQGECLGLGDDIEVEPGITAGERDMRRQKEKVLYTKISTRSLVLIILGAILQGVALWI